jgi:hypothetical protein
MDTSTKQRVDPRSREAHPERIVVADETFLRNDKMAEKHGVSERTLQRDDARGAPYRFFGGVKYRPEKRYDTFILDSIQTRVPQPQSEHKRGGGRRGDGAF